ncbi:MAG: YqiA/YcfP family alpha/beta fold hydrolase [Pseudomonadota bacterium]|nr:YqiA/YcfP family alpha/beta fold hydrolase [Pseudomonadota bacterium]
MTGCICVYLHGFLSSEHSHKGQWFKQNLPGLITADHSIASCQVLTPSYPMKDPHETVQFLIDFLNQAGLLSSNNNWFLAGSSMGGFYAQHLAHQFNKPFIMINPALDPVNLFEDYAGEHLNKHTDEVINIDQSYREALKAYYQLPNKQIESLLLLDQGDEVIPYQHAFNRYQTDNPLQMTKVFEDGDHAFQHLDESVGIIKTFIEGAVLKNQKS